MTDGGYLDHHLDDYDEYEDDLESQYIDDCQERHYEEKYG